MKFLQVAQNNCYSVISNRRITFSLAKKKKKKKMYQNMNLSSKQMSGYIVKDVKLGPDKKNEKTLFSLKIVSKSLFWLILTIFKV